MTTESTLQQQTNAFKDQLSLEALSVMHNHIDRLVLAGVSQRGLRPGQQAPDLSLPDPLGKQIKLSTLITGKTSCCSVLSW